MTDSGSDGLQPLREPANGDGVIIACVGDTFPSPIILGLQSLLSRLMVTEGVGVTLGRRMFSPESSAFSRLARSFFSAKTAEMT